jgi:hypothetical protein
LRRAAEPRCLAGIWNKTLAGEVAAASRCRVRFAFNRLNRSKVTAGVNDRAAKNAGILRPFGVLPKKKAVTGFGI